MYTSVVFLLCSQGLQAVGFQGQQTRETHKISLDRWTRGAWDRLFSHRARWRCSNQLTTSSQSCWGSRQSRNYVHGSCKWCLQHTSSSAGTATATSALIYHHRYQRRSLSAQGPQSSVDQHEVFTKKQPTHEGLKPQRTQSLVQLNLSPKQHSHNIWNVWHRCPSKILSS